MKLINLIVILIILQGTMILFDQVYKDDPCIGDCSDEFELTSYGDNESLIWTFATNPTDWRGTDWLTFLLGILAVGGVAFAVGALMGYKGDIFLFSGLFSVFLATAAVPMIGLYNVIAREPTFWGCTSVPCPATTLVWLFTGGIFSVIYLLTVIQWLRTGSMK